MLSLVPALSKTTSFLKFPSFQADFFILSFATHSMLSLVPALSKATSFLEFPSFQAEFFILSFATHSMLSLVPALSKATSSLEFPSFQADSKNVHISHTLLPTRRFSILIGPFALIVPPSSSYPIKFLPPPFGSLIGPFLIDSCPSNSNNLISINSRPIRGRSEGFPIPCYYPLCVFSQSSHHCPYPCQVCVRVIRVKTIIYLRVIIRRHEVS